MVIRLSYTTLNQVIRIDVSFQMYAFDSFDDKALILELLNGMYSELPEKKPKKAT